METYFTICKIDSQWGKKKKNSKNSPRRDNVYRKTSFTNVPKIGCILPIWEILGNLVFVEFNFKITNVF